MLGLRTTTATHHPSTRAVVSSFLASRSALPLPTLLQRASRATPPHTSAAASRRSSTTRIGSSGSSSSPVTSTSSSSMSSTEDDEQAASGKLNVLCLHGFLQSATVFRARTGSMRKGLKSRVHFLFQDAPFHAASTLTEEQVARFGGSSEGLTWFQWQDLGPDKRPSLAVKYAKWDVTYAALCDALRQHKPDGLFGFSQGATATALFLASLLTAQRQGRDLDVPLPQFCVVCAGFLPNDPEYATLLKDARVDIPALFIIGEADALIPPHRTQELVDTFDPAAVTVLRHPGAHFVPTCSGEYKQSLCAFLDRFKSSSSSAAAAASSRKGTNTAKASASVGSSLGSLAEGDDEGGGNRGEQPPVNESAEDAEQQEQGSAAEAAVQQQGRL